jgi:hypothetical protein
VALIVVIIYVAIKNIKIGFPSLLVLLGFLIYTMVETSTLFDPTIEGIVTTSLVALPSLSCLYHKKRPEVNDKIVKSAEHTEVKCKKENIFIFVRKVTLFSNLILVAALIFVFALLKANNSKLINYLFYGGLILVSLISIPIITHQIYKIRLKRKEMFFWFIFISTIIIHFGFLLTCILLQELFIFIIGLSLIIAILIISLLAGIKNRQVNKNYLIKTFLLSLVIILSITLVATPIVFSGKATLVILGEVIVLLAFLAVPFINNVSKFKMALNDKMLLSFARNIKH